MLLDETTKAQLSLTRMTNQLNYNKTKTITQRAGEPTGPPPHRRQLLSTGHAQVQAQRVALLERGKSRRRLTRHARSVARPLRPRPLPGQLCTAAHCCQDGCGVPVAVAPSMDGSAECADHFCQTAR